MFCSKCGIENLNEANFCKSCGAAMRTEAVPLAMPNPDNPTTGLTDVHYAGFWRRGAAAIVDWQIVGAAAAMSRFVSTKSDGVQIIGSIVILLLVGLWFALLESRDSATLGKRLFHLAVLRTDKSKLSFARASGRYFGRFISAIILGVGYVMQPFTAKKQALHDMMTDSVVVQNKKGRDGFVVAAWLFQILLLVVTIAINVNSKGDEAYADDNNQELNIGKNSQNKVLEPNPQQITTGAPVDDKRLSTSFLPTAAELAQTSIRIHPMKGEKSLDVEVGNVTGSCGNSVIRIVGITKAFDNVYTLDGDGRIIIRASSTKEISIFSDDYNGMACVSTQSGDNLLVWHNCGGSACGDFNFYVIDPNSLTYLAPKNPQKELCDAKCASQMLGNYLPQEINNR